MAAVVALYMCQDHIDKGSYNSHIYVYVPSGQFGYTHINVYNCLAGVQNESSWDVWFKRSNLPCIPLQGGRFLSQVNVDPLIELVQQLLWPPLRVLQPEPPHLPQLFAQHISPSWIPVLQVGSAGSVQSNDVYLLGKNMRTSNYTTQHVGGSAAKKLT